MLLFLPSLDIAHNDLAKFISKTNYHYYTHKIYKFVTNRSVSKCTNSFLSCDISPSSCFNGNT